MAGPLNGPQVRDKLLEEGKKSSRTKCIFLGKYYKDSSRHQ